MANSKIFRFQWLGTVSLAMAKSLGYEPTKANNDIEHQANREGS